MRVVPGGAAPSIPDVGPTDTRTPPSGPPDDARAHALNSLRELIEVVRPTTIAAERVIPVDESLEQLLDGGLRRGTTVRVEGSVGTTSLGLALCARATSSGLWMGCLNAPSVGWAAADAMGVDLCRVVSVEVPTTDVADAMAAMVDVFDLVMCDGLEGMSSSQSQKISARVRERGCVLLVVDGPVIGDRRLTAGGLRSITGGGRSGRPIGTEGSADVVVSVDQVSWSGLGDGRGRLRSRSTKVVVHGRRHLASPRSAEIG